MGNGLFRFLNNTVKRCPKTGKILGVNFKSTLSKFLFPLFGIAAILWFIIRVVPKPSRIAYPCQQIAAGIGSSFIVWLLGAAGSIALFQKIKKHSLILASLFLVSAASFGIIFTNEAKDLFDGSGQQILTPLEGANKPMGTARGIFPGRVVWSQDFNATSWDGEYGHWWDDNNTNQNVVDELLSKTIRKLTKAKSDTEAWQKLFKYHNNKFKDKNAGYRKGEKIVIKINCNADGKINADWASRGYPSPHVIYSLVKQLIENAGVPGEDITISDPSRFIGYPIYNKIRSNPKMDYQQVRFEEKTSRPGAQRFKAMPDTLHPVYFNMPGNRQKVYYLPESFSEAAYIINLAELRPHRVFGVTMCSKNLFGVVYDPLQKAFRPDSLHAFALWDYKTPNKQGEIHCSPVLLGNKITNGKTFLYLLDGLYTAKNQGLDVVRWSTMNNDWCSSILMSQDPIALESVGYDLIVNEPNLTNDNPSFNGNVDNYLHEDALAPNSPSGMKYDPMHDGNIVTSLGVHEHWNNVADKKYSRNLGLKKGIELVLIR